MRLQVKVIHLVDGISSLGGHKSISRGAAAGGPRPAKDIQRVAGGYLIEWAGSGGTPGLFFVPDAQIACAQVVRVPDDDELPAAALEPSSAEEQPQAPALTRSDSPALAADPARAEPAPPVAGAELVPQLDGGGALPDGIEVGPGGVYRRADPTPPPPVDPADQVPPDTDKAGAPYQPSRRRGGPRPAKGED